MRIGRPLLGFTCALIVPLAAGCGPTPVERTATPHPELEKAIDTNNPAFKQIEGSKGAKR